MKKTGLKIAFLLLGALSLNSFQISAKMPTRQMEKLGRGVVAVRKSANQVFVTWRYLSADPMKISFNVYRNGKKVASVPASQGTYYLDSYGDISSADYQIKPVMKGKELTETCGKYTLPANAPIGYVDIPLVKPADGVTPSGDTYQYNANDASIGDVDGDGSYEIILKWDPSNSHDNAHDGYTGNVLFDCYRLTGEKLWRIDLGRNVRAGAHYTQFMVYDLDGDGCSEVVMKTSDGTIDGKGKIIGDANADYREVGEPVDVEKLVNKDPNINKVIEKNKDWKPTNKNQGRILTGNEYLTVFSGLTGEAMKTIDYVPARGNLSDWGDNRANRSDRFLACVAYLDGVHPSVVMCRGYYTRAVLAAYDWDGKELKSRWVFDSKQPGNEGWSGQGNHNLRVADVDGDGCDEIIYGQCAIDNNGKGLYTTGMGHGDAMHLTKFAPDMEGFQIWGCHENKKDGTSFRNAATGEVIFQEKSSDDVGRCMAADIDPTNYGLEMWSWQSKGIRNIKGGTVNPNMRTLSVNMAVWWDGDLMRELLDKAAVSKYDWKEGVCKPLQQFEGITWNNGTKANPSIQGDIVGDWREEILFRTPDSSSLRLYVSTYPTEYRFHTFMEDPLYRLSIVTQNVAYNQPTHPGFYFGPDLKKCLFRGYLFK
nr:rhamnogalacturonan lyase [Phocaeicola paurosaccharolyticus]